jgi:hypothetical protein
MIVKRYHQLILSCIKSNQINLVLYIIDISDKVNFRELALFIVKYNRLELLKHVLLRVPDDELSIVMDIVKRTAIFYDKYEFLFCTNLTV